MVGYTRAHTHTHTHTVGRPVQVGYGACRSVPGGVPSSTPVHEGNRPTHNSCVDYVRYVRVLVHALDQEVVYMKASQAACHTVRIIGA